MDIKKTLLFFTLISLFAPASAEVDHEYFGISLGLATLDSGDNSFIQSGDTEPSLSFGLYGAGVTDEGFGVELGFISMDKFASKDFDGVYSRAYGMELSPLYEFPMSESFSMYVKAGLYAWKISNKNTTTRWNTTGTSTTYGLGAIYRPKSSNLIWRFSAQYYNDLDDASITRVSVDLGFGF